MVRNCPRCLQDFLAAEGQWVCVECRFKKGYWRPIAGTPLTQREKSVVFHLGECKSNKEIAEALHLSPGTVKTYMSSIFIKLGLTSRVKVAMWANSEEFAKVKSVTMPE